MARGRIPNSALAQAASIAESTAHNRLRTLTESGVILGIHADVNMAALGRPFEAQIQVQIHSSARTEIHAEAERIAHCPGVVEVCFIGGSRDLLVRVAMPDSAALRDFILTELSSIASTETFVILERFRGAHPLG